MVTADAYRTFRVAGMLGEFGRRRAQNFPQMARLEANPDAIDSGAGFPEQPDGLVIAAELDANLGQDPVGRALDGHQTGFIQNIVGGDTPAYIRGCYRTAATLGLAARAGAAAPAPLGISRSHGMLTPLAVRRQALYHAKWMILC